MTHIGFTKDYFFKLGEYDPEIKYYGAEHVELSFRVWMCGGSMENIPCSNVGHIYREFNRQVCHLPVYVFCACICLPFECLNRSRLAIILPQIVGLDHVHIDDYTRQV